MDWSAPIEPVTIPDLIAEADKSVAGLKDQKKRLATVIHRHLVSAFNDRKFKPNNILMIGPTGGGKTYLVTKMLEACGLPFIEVNATQYSEVGFIGQDLAWMFYGFLDKYDARPKEIIPDVERWGVVILDEVDKWRQIPNPKERQPGLALQAELLKMLEGDLSIAKRSDREQGWPFHTHHILFIGVGAFEGLDTQMQKQVDIDMPNRYMQAEPMDIMRYGFMQELVGRFPSVVALPPLDSKSMSRILQQSIWPRYQQEATDRGIELITEQNALQEISGQTIQKRIGARGFATVLDNLLWDAWATAEPGDQIILGVPEVLNRKAVVRKRERKVA